MNASFKYKAALYSTRPGLHKKAFAYCAHEHESRELANKCAEQLERANLDRRRWWRVAEIVYVIRPVRNISRGGYRP